MVDHRRDEVPLGALLQGLLLVSGDDAATALAEHDAGTVRRFVRRMNETAARLGLECSRFASPHGLIGRGNHSCPRGLATLARIDLAEPRIAAIAGVVLLASPNPLEQVPKLLELGARA